LDWVCKWERIARACRWLYRLRHSWRKEEDNVVVKIPLVTPTRSPPGCSGSAPAAQRAAALLTPSHSSLSPRRRIFSLLPLQSCRPSIPNTQTTPLSPLALIHHPCCCSDSKTDSTSRSDRVKNYVNGSGRRVRVTPPHDRLPGRNFCFPFSFFLSDHTINIYLA
jgi:hypothetical protein